MRRAYPWWRALTAEAVRPLREFGKGMKTKPHAGGGQARRRQASDQRENATAQGLRAPHAGHRLPARRDDARLEKKPTVRSPPLSPLGPPNPTALPSLGPHSLALTHHLPLQKPFGHPRPDLSLVAARRLDHACKSTTMMMIQACRCGMPRVRTTAAEVWGLARAACARLRGPRGGFGRRCNAGICAFTPLSREIVMRISRRVAVTAAASAPPGLAKANLVPLAVLAWIGGRK